MARVFSFDLGFSYKDGRNHGGGMSAGTSEDLSHTLAECAYSVSYYQNECGYNVEVNIWDVCGCCGGTGQVMGTRRRSKRCPDCKGKDSTRLVANYWAYANENGKTYMDCHREHLRVKATCLSPVA